MKNQNGFTIIELVISIFILSIAIIGIFNAFSMMVVLTSNTEDRLTAAYLAQEGMEVIRNIRDSNWLNADANTNPDTIVPWDDGLSECEQSTGCEVDYKTTGPDSLGFNLNPVRPWAEDYLKIDPINGFYNCNTGTTTKFKRKIKIQTASLPPYVMKVLVQVSWDEKANILDSTGHLAGDCGQSNCIQVEDTLYNWYNYEFPVNE